MLIRLSILNCPSDDFTVPKIDDGISIFEQPDNIRFKPGDVPCPYLIRPGDKDWNSLMIFYRFLGFQAMLNSFPFSQYTIERTCASVVNTFFSKHGNDLLRRVISETRTIGNGIECLFFQCRQAMSDKSGTSFSFVSSVTSDDIFPELSGVIFPV